MNGMNPETVKLEARVMRHLGNAMAFEMVLIALIRTHPQKDELFPVMQALRKQYTELVNGSMMMVDDVSPQAGVAVEQMNKMLNRLMNAAKSVDA